MNWFKRLFAPLAAFLAIASPAAARAPQQQARPALWEVKHADSTIYLFGTIHLLPTGYHWRTPKFDKALSSSNELVVETIVDLQHPDEILNAKRELGYSAGLPPIEDRVPPAKRTRLRAMIAKTGVPEQYFTSMFAKGKTQIDVWQRLLVGGFPVTGTPARASMLCVRRVQFAVSLPFHSLRSAH